MTAGTRTLLVEGWRQLPHSYSIANSFQCIEMLGRPNLRLLHRDLPYYLPHWQSVHGLFSAEEEARIAAIPAPPPGERPDAVLRMGFPFDFSPADAPRTLVFGTAEFRCVPPSFVAGGRPLAAAMRGSEAVMIACSSWTRDGFLASGAEPARVKLVPLGVDPRLHHPLPDDQRAALRRQLGWDGYVFLSLGAMTGCKGMLQLLKAFAIVAQRHPHARLCTKGLDSLYQSHSLLQAEFKNLTQAEIQIIEPRMFYTGQVLPFADVARLYQAADAYVSPYLAEGFNLPVLEAAASGLPSICTAGGSTDDFTRPEFAARIQSTLRSFLLPCGTPATQLVPDFDHLVQLMLDAITRPDFFARARQSGPAFVTAGHTWSHTVDKLLQAAFGTD